jgi:SAM-dependent methyltransferase
MKITHCRYCGANLQPILSLGNLPLVNYFPKKNEQAREKRYPLNFVICTGCGLAQLDYIVPPDDVFLHYHYTTGASFPLVAELGRLAETTVSRFHLTHSSQVLDIGSNDGTLLTFFVQKNIKVLGVEPSRFLGKFAKERGISTINGFFSNKIAETIRKTRGQFDLIFATHVLANIVNLKDFTSGIKEILAPQGTVIIEVGYLGSMLARGEFDAIYHEHYSYFSLQTLSRILNDQGLSIIDVERCSAQGGAIRVYAQHTSVVVHPYEIHERITNAQYVQFVRKILEFREKFRRILQRYLGKTIVGVGAPAKAVTLLSYCGIKANTIAYIVDSTPAKQGRVLPGVHIPIEKPTLLIKKQPDVVVIFAWNYRDAIIDQLIRILPKGTPVIVPFPNLTELKT